MSSAVLVQTNGVGAVVPPVDEGADRGVGVNEGGEDSAADRLPFDDAEPDLDQVYLGGVGRGEVHDEPRVLREPLAEVLVLVGGVVVHH